MRTEDRLARELMEAAERETPEAFPPVSQVAALGRRRLALSVAGAIAAVGMLAVGAWAASGLLGLDAGRPTPADPRPDTHLPTVLPTLPDDPDSNYRFEVLEIAPDTGQVRVSYRGAWTSETYPGMRECTWTAYGERGKAVGEVTRKTVMLAPGDENTLVIPVSAPAEFVEASCGQRLDVGDPYAYAFRLQLEPSRSSGGVVTVTWKATWLGPGVPGTVVCDLSVSAGGKVVGANAFGTLSSMSDTFDGATAVPIHLPQEELARYRDDPAGYLRSLEPEMSCVPYTKPLSGSEPSPETSPTGSVPGLAGVPVSVLNATRTDALALSTAALIERYAGAVVVFVGNAEIPQRPTIVYFRSNETREAAEALAEWLSHEARVERLPTPSMAGSQDAAVVVYLGEEYVG